MIKVGESVKLDTEPHCLCCGEVLDGATNIGDTVRPAPDDLSICLYCGHLMAFDHELKLRELTSEEMHECAGDPRILEVQAARSRVMKKECH